MSIEERAKYFRSTKEDEFVDLVALEKGYIQGATEQREIDIQKACSVLRDILVFEFGLKEDNPIDKDCIAEDIEKLCKAMKGE